MVRLQRAVLMVITLVSLLGPLTAAHAQPDDAVPAAAGFAPEFLNESSYDLRGLVGSTQDTWTVGGGYLYWSNCFVGPKVAEAGGEQQAAVDAQPAATTYLRRWSLSGGRAITLSDTGFCDAALWSADASGLYYVRRVGNDYNIYRRATTSPTTETLVYSANTQIYSIAADGGFVYALRDTLLFGAAIYRVPNTGGSMGFFGTAGGTTVSNLIAAANGFYWFADGKLMRMGRDCGGDCITALGNESGGRLLANAAYQSFSLGGNSNPLWVNGQSIRSYQCRLSIGGGGCTIGNAYNAPGSASDPNNTYRYLPGQLATDGQYLFWVDEHQRYSPGGGLFPPGYYSTGESRLMKWHLRPSLFTNNVFDTPQPIACQNCSGSYAVRPAGTAAGNGWVYFVSSRGLARIRGDAPPVSWDLAADSVEVTQAVQNLNNDVPLVAGKATFVRVMARKFDGPAAMNVRARLVGTDANGNALPGSPLAPLGPGQNLVDNNAMDRTNQNAGWLFALPSNWANAANATFTAQIDPGAVFIDTNRQNNNRSASVNFVRKAPVCIVAVPVRTSAPAANSNDPGYRRQIAVLRKLYPVSDVWTYQQNEDVAEYEFPFSYGPYELPDDGSKVLQALWWRDAFSDDPDACDDAGARTHYVGMVPATTPMGNNLGLGRLDSAVLYTRLVPAENWGDEDYRNQRFNTLAHELGHNYDRRHVNCGSPADVDASYPYSPCTIDSRSLTAATTYFGFEPSLQRILRPDQTADYMAYRAPYWTSDYTYRALFNGIANRQSVASVGAEKANLAAASALVYLSGIVDPVANTGSLDYAWVFPDGALSAGMRRKAAQLDATVAYSAAAARSYTVVLLDASGATLASRDFVPPETSDHDGSARGFNLVLPAPNGIVARIELRDGATVLATRAPGAGAPTIALLAPAGGASFDRQLTLSWQASDPDNDPLLYSVQYTPDNGQTWRAILTNIPNPASGNTVTIALRDITDLPGNTTSAQIRVAASDGYHTTFATSAAFSVANRAPTVAIDAPGAAASFAAGTAIVLRGGAIDAEDGPLADAALSWRIDGAVVGSGALATVSGLAPGSYTTTLTASDAQGTTAVATTTFTVEALSVPQGSAPTLDGACNDDAYAAGVNLALGDGSRGSVQLVRSETRLFACFSGLARSAGDALLRVDTNHSREATLQEGDVSFAFAQDGTASVRRGGGAAETPAANSVDARVSADETQWNVEVALDADQIGGWNAVVGLLVGQDGPGGQQNWPARAAADAPQTWATTVFGAVPRIATLSPNSAPQGSPALTFRVSGSGFAAGSVVRWNGSALPTTVVDASTLDATIDAALLRTAGTASITVHNANGAPSNALPFAVDAQARATSGGTRIFTPIILR